MPPTSHDSTSTAGTPETTSPRRILVLATERCVGTDLLDELRAHAQGGPARIRLVAPALTSRLDYWASDESSGREAARKRLAASLEECSALGVEIEGDVGDADPLLAIDDEIRTFDPDEIVVATHPAPSATWLERDLVPQARARYEVPITHLEVNPQTGSGRLVTPPEEPSRHRRESHRKRDLAVLVGVSVLAVIGTLISFTLYELDVATWLLAIWVLVMDLGVKVLLIVILWSLFLRRGRADRLDY